jgi:hypothetical protein
MRELLRRIAINGGLAALILGVIGYFLADLAAATLQTPIGTRSAGAPSAEEAERGRAIVAEMRYTIPRNMAIWGMGFVVGFEILRHLIRGRRTTTPAPPRPAPPPDETEKLLEELLAQAEAKAGKGVLPDSKQLEDPAASAPLDTAAAK